MLGYSDAHCCNLISADDINKILNQREEYATENVSSE
jgi:hypothetical protein